MIRPALLCLFGVIGAWCATPSQALECRDVVYEDIPYSLCEVDTTTDHLRLFLNDSDGANLGQFYRIENQAAAQGKTLSFAMNAGMYHANRSPVGHYIEDGETQMRVIPNAGPGNFGLLPNGVLCITDTRAEVIETLRYLAQTPLCRDATQSGPMLVIDGALHPRFLIDSTSRFIRNGVGTSADGTHAVFVISNRTVSFHEFGRFFRDYLKLPQALYFDGKVSRIFAPQLGRSDAGFAMGPIVGVVTPQ